MSLEETASAKNSAEDRHRHIHFLSWLVAWWMSVAVVLGMLSLPPTLSSYDKSRWNTVWALTHGKGYVIDEAPYRSIDRVKREGHFYSSKPPLYPTLLAGVAAGIQAVSGWELPDDDVYIIRIILFLVNVPPFFAVLILYGKLLARSDCDWHTAALCLVTAAGGTYLTTYSATLTNHTVGAYSLFFTAYCLIRIIYDDLSGWKYFFGAGLFAAWTVCNELPAGAFGLAVFVWLYRKNPKSTLFYFVPITILVFTLFLYTTYLANGSFLPYYLQSHLYRYEGSYWNDPQGVNGNDDSVPFYLFNMLLGHHGMFSMTPILIVALAGLMTDTKRRALNMLVLALTAIMLLFLAVVKTGDYGGWCHGPRWLFWLIPGYLLALPYGIALTSQSKLLRGLVYVALAISMVSVALGWAGNSGPWTRPWTGDLMRKLDLISY